MVFKSPSWVPSLPCPIPDDIPVGEFVLSGYQSPRAETSGASPLICGITGKQYTLNALREQVDLVAQSLSNELGWKPNEGESWDKVLAIYSFNSVEYLILCWAVHRLNGICLTIHTGSSNKEIEQHLTRSKCKAIFVSPSLLKTCLQVTNPLDIPQKNIYTIPVPGEPVSTVDGHKSFEQLLAAGPDLPSLEPLKWERGQGKKQVAYLAATSGTSGLQKLAKIGHYNIIANILQTATFDGGYTPSQPESGILFLPLSHTYALEVSHMLLWQGDAIILQPNFDMMKMLKAVTTFKLERLYLVPAIVGALIKNPFLFQMFDLSSVKTIISGSAPFDKNLGEAVKKVRPDWKILPGYGLTESSIIATFTNAHDQMYGSSGSLLPEVQLRLIDENGIDIEEHEKPGEVLLKGPNIISGYLNDPEATATLIDSEGWLHSGDVGLIRLSPQQNEHLVIVDRLRDMIKVKGMQVSPTDIEAALIVHPAVRDVAVIGVKDEHAGERAKAFVVRSPDTMQDLSEEQVKESIREHVEKHLSELHWLHDRISFIAEIPKNQNNKILKVKLRAMERGE
ncbi:hypothetical protein EYB25_009430 [Talaromyces marneffei]|nr:hypothetical protein EYB25_009430 [Talaromyces marneffei]